MAVLECKKRDKYAARARETTKIAFLLIMLQERQGLAAGL
jgi:hypothetical protein